MGRLRDSEGSVVLRLSYAEAVVLHEAIAGSEFSNDLKEIELRQPVEQKVFSETQQVRIPFIPDLGTGDYQGTVDRAYAMIDPGPFGPRPH